MRKRGYFRLAAAAAFLVAGMGLPVARPALAVDKPAIKFAPGTSGATVTGEISGMDRDTYPIVGAAGQTMEVSVKNSAKLVLFHIQTPEGEGHYLPGAGEEDDATTFKGTLPQGGRYVILVGAMRGRDTRYTLTVSIKK